MEIHGNAPEGAEAFIMRGASKENPVVKAVKDAYRLVARTLSDVWGGNTYGPRFRQQQPGTA
jgi:hypothetical protein